MKDSDWNIIYELYKTKNITKAANNLFLTQPTLTKRLQQIEEELGTQLVNRTPRGITITPEGEYMAGQAEQYIRFWQATRKKMDEFRRKGYGTIRILSSFTFSKYYLFDIVREFIKIYPNISFDLQVGRSDLTTKLLLEGRADIAFVRGDYETEMEKEVILSDRAYVISKEPLDLGKLPELYRVDSILGEQTRRRLDRWWEEHYDQPPRTAVSVWDADSSWQVVMRGLGYTLGFFSSRNLKELGVWSSPLLDLNGNPLTRTTSVVYQKEIIKTEYVRHFLEFTKNYLQKNAEDGEREN